MTPENFSSMTEKIFVYVYYICYSLTALIAISGLIFILVTKRYNAILLCLYFVVLIDTTTFVTLENYSIQHPYRPLFMTSLSVNTAADALSHLIVSYAYLKVIIELKALMDKQIHLKNYEKLAEVSKEKARLFRVTVALAALCVADGIYCLCGFLFRSVKNIIISQFVVVTQDFSFLCLWGLSLIMLNRKVKQSKQLIPNRLLFCLHGSVLVCYVVFNTIFLITFSLSYDADGDKLFIIDGVSNIAGSLLAFFECSGFILVFALMTPLGQKK